jgi:hypothetical protein
MKKIAVLLFVLTAALTAALVPAFAGGSGGSASDEAAPVTTVTAGPIGPTNVTSATFMFTADQTGSQFFCSLDSTTFSPCATPVTYTGIVDGHHAFFAYAVRDGKQGPTASWSWTIDTVPPVPVTGVHAAVGYGKLRLSWTPSPGTDHVVIFRSVGSNKTATQVYAGGGQTYADSKFVNSLEHRYGFISFDKAGNASPPLGLTVAKSALLLGPRDGVTVRRAHPPSLRWRAVPRATFYNAQLWRGRHKVLSTWPMRAHVRLTRAWRYKNRRYHLKPGLYAWFVWPGFGPPRKGIYGKLIGAATFRVR